MAQPLIALLTDFGTSDPYVGVMKGVIATRCPTARLIDITHEVSPQSIREAAYLLQTAYKYFPAHTVFLVVVDPGVGTTRNPVAIQTSHGLFVGPDNGVFSAVIDEVDTWQAVVLWPPTRLSATFHGRDLFAPIAADLAGGRALSDVGTPTADLQRLDMPWGTLTEPGKLQGEVIHIDHFGNIATSIGSFEWDAAGRDLRLAPKHSETVINFPAATAEVIVGTFRIVGISSTYASTGAGNLLTLINSDQHLEIAVNQGNGAHYTGARIGDIVQICFQSNI
jgi:S-adenosyl-L-methionine hydrolase (adenosine-forming)